MRCHPTAEVGFLGPNLPGRWSQPYSCEELPVILTVLAGVFDVGLERRRVVWTARANAFEVMLRRVNY